MTYALGVDIGTAYTAAAVWRDGRASTVGLADRTDSIPSALFLREDGGLLVGHAAVRRGVLEPDRLATGFKKRLGDKQSMLVGDELIGAPELMGHLLRFVLDVVTSREGSPPAHVTLTCPAAWDDHHRACMTSVAEHARLADVGLLMEPVAIAVHYAALARLEPGSVAAIYDLGGGTFDAALVERTADGYELRGRPGGDDRIGGQDFDNAVMEHVKRHLGSALTMLEPSDEAVAAGLHQVHQNAVAAKEALSSDVDTTIPVILPGITREVRLTRSELESALRIPLLRTVDALERTIASAGLQPQDLRAVLLAGGSSRIPLVSQLLVSELGVTVVADAHPKHAVALGAALVAAQRLPPAAPQTALAASFLAQLSLPPPAGQRLLPDADLLVPVPVAAPVLPTVTPQQLGLYEPADVSLHPARLPGSPRDLRDSDKLVVDHTADRRRGGRLAAAVVLTVIAVLAAVIGAGYLLAVGGPGPIPAAAPASPASHPTSPGINPAGSPFLLAADIVRAAVGDVVLGAGSTGIGPMAVGASADPADDPQATGLSIRVWRAAGRTWNPSTAPPVEPGLSSGASGVTTTGTGSAVVAGWVAPGTGSRDSRIRRRGRLWVSSDGDRWAAATLPEVGEVTGVVSRTGGGLVAVAVPAGDVASTQRPPAVVLTSTNGAVWTARQATGPAGAAPPQELHGLLADGARLLAIGWSQDGSTERSRIWSSPDGIAWSAGPELAGTGVGTATAWGLARGRSGAVLAVGVETGVDGTTGPVLWRLAGDTWTPQRLAAPTAQLFGATLIGDVVVVIGRQTGGPGARATAAVWTAAG